MLKTVIKFSMNSICYKVTKLIPEFKELYVLPKYDVGVVKTPFHSQLKKDTVLSFQTPIKVPIHFQQKLNVFRKIGK